MAPQTYYAVAFNASVDMGDAGWLVQTYGSENVRALHTVELQTPKSTSKKLVMTTQWQRKAILWTAFTSPPDKVYSDADMPGIPTGNPDDPVPWYCTGYTCKFNEADMLYHIFATYENWGPIHKLPMTLALTLPDSLDTYTEVTDA